MDSPDPPAPSPDGDEKPVFLPSEQARRLRLSQLISIIAANPLAAPNRRRRSTPDDPDVVKKRRQNRAKNKASRAARRRNRRKK